MVSPIITPEIEKKINAALRAVEGNIGRKKISSYVTPVNIYNLGPLPESYSYLNKLVCPSVFEIKYFKLGIEPLKINAYDLCIKLNLLMSDIALYVPAVPKPRSVFIYFSEPEILLASDIQANVRKVHASSSIESIELPVEAIRKKDNVPILSEGIGTFKDIRSAYFKAAKVKPERQIKYTPYYAHLNSQLNHYPEVLKIAVENTDPVLLCRALVSICQEINRSTAPLTNKNSKICSFVIEDACKWLRIPLK